MTGSHDGRVAIVTGGGRGLGRAMTLGLLEAGARVVVTDIDADPLAETAGAARGLDAGDRIELMVIDIGRDESAAQVIERSLTRFGRLDILINNAGTSVDLLRRGKAKAPASFWEIEPAEFRRVVEVNTVAPFLLTRAALGPMLKQKWGRVINVTTSLDTMWRKGLIPYGGSKAANEAHVVAMAEELRGTGVTVNVLTPGGPADTRLIPPDSGMDRAKLIRPEVMVAPLLWLTSAASDGMTGLRFLAAKWDKALPATEAARNCSAQAAWQQLGQQAIYPGGSRP
jgi:3-oxoacyl-[acyl-carrier protein] reductase